MAVVPYRRGRQPHQFLADIIDAAIGNRIFQALALGWRQFAGQNRSVAGKTGNAAAIGALDRHPVEPRQHFLAGGFLAAPPGRDVRHLQILAEQAPRQTGQEAEQRARLQHARARHVGDDDAILPDDVDQAGHAKLRGSVKLQRIEKIGIDPAQQHVEPLQPGDGADVNAVAADREVVALDQQEAEIARQRRVLKIGLAEIAGRQQPDARFVAVGAGAQTVAERLEERRDALDIHRLVQRGKGARQHQAVFQRIARARRRLRPVAEHPPAAVGTAANIGGVQIEIAAAGRLDPAHRAQIFGTACDRGRRHRAVGNQAALAIEIAEHHLEQLRALHDA